ncbi:MAG: hypothetical protein OEW08_03085 [Gammaproteobacteria bacterium]|nr:hypothetical protein [Gammaproteobacteria bacterium]
MRAKHLIRVIGLGLGAVIQLRANALSLDSEVRVRTFIGQPLRAEIYIPTATKAELDTLQINLAPGREYTNLGLEYLALLDRLQFHVERRPDGTALIAIDTPTSIFEPALPIVLEVKWSGGHLMREYAIALDLPKVQVQEQRNAPNNNNGNTTKPLAQTLSNPSLPSTAPITNGGTENDKPASNPQRANKKVNPRLHDGQYGPIGTDETLSEIAQNVRPDPKISLPQMIIGLYNANPDAFVDGDINRLKEGEHLALPDADHYRAVSRKMAMQTLDELIEGKRPPPQTKNAFKVELSAPTHITSDGSELHGATPDATPHDANVANNSRPADGTTVSRQLAETSLLINQLQKQNEELQTKIESMQRQSLVLLQQLEMRGIVIPNAPVVGAPPAPPATVGATTITPAAPVTHPRNNGIAPTKRIITTQDNEGPDGTLIVVLAIIVTVAAGLAQLLTDTNRQKIIDWLRSRLHRGGTSL